MKTVAAGLGAAPWIGRAETRSSPWRFLTPEEAVLVDAVAEQIIPGDEDPGAHEAGVVFFMDRQLAGPYRRFQEEYRAGLAGLNETSREMFNRGFVDLSWEQQTEVLKRLESGKATGTTWRTKSSADFFRMLRDHAMQGFYGSPRHGGNRNYASYRMLQLAYPQIIGQNRYRNGG
jgi:gluconate 2-dehydrogenase gamma chain